MFLGVIQFVAVGSFWQILPFYEIVFKISFVFKSVLLNIVIPMFCFYSICSLFPYIPTFFSCFRYFQLHVSRIPFTSLESHYKDLFICLGMSFVCRYVSAPGKRMRALDPGSWSYRWLWATPWVLRTKSGSFARAKSVFNRWPTSLASSFEHTLNEGWHTLNKGTHFCNGSSEITISQMEQPQKTFLSEKFYTNV